MRAMVLDAPGRRLRLADLPRPQPGPGELLLRVTACAVCRTDLHVLDGELPSPALPLIPGHEIVGIVEATYPGATRFAAGARVGVPWLGWTCGECSFCLAGAENLCAAARFTGYTRQGGYADYTIADERFCFPPAGRLRRCACGAAAVRRPDRLSGIRMAVERPFGGDAARIGLYGFGVAAHLLAQVAVAEGRQVHAFTRTGDRPAQEHARRLGAVWAGDSDERPPDPLDAAILFAPVGALVPSALHVVRPGGVVICAGIHMSDIPSFPYALLWQERVVRSVANLTREDGDAFLAVAARGRLRVDTTSYALEDANTALDDLRHGRLQGAAVLVP